MNQDKNFMLAAIECAKLAKNDGEVPIGAVIVKQGKIIATGRNRREYGKNALAHAEIEAINNACNALGGWRLPGCTIYVTLEPCPMCAGAIINSRIERVVYGAADPKAGSVDSLTKLFELPYNHRPEVTSGILEEECAKILSDFFKELREKKISKKKSGDG